MTCIIGLEHDGKVYVGGDSAGVSGLALQIRADEKVFHVGPFLMGFTSSFRMGQLLRYSLKVPEQTSTQDEYAFMVTTFIGAVRSCLKDGGYAEVNNGKESGGTFLVGYKGKLYRVHGDFQVGRVATGYDAVGCGNQLALGCLYVTATSGPVTRIHTALEAAAEHSAGVCGPFVVESA